MLDKTRASACNARRDRLPARTSQPPLAHRATSYMAERTAETTPLRSLRNAGIVTRISTAPCIILRSAAHPCSWTAGEVLKVRLRMRCKGQRGDNHRTSAMLAVAMLAVAMVTSRGDERVSRW